MFSATGPRPGVNAGDKGDEVPEALGDLYRDDEPVGLPGAGELPVEREKSSAFGTDNRIQPGSVVRDEKPRAGLDGGGAHRYSGRRSFQKSSSIGNVPASMSRTVSITDSMLPCKNPSRTIPSNHSGVLQMPPSTEINTGFFSRTAVVISSWVPQDMHSGRIWQIRKSERSTSRRSCVRISRIRCATSTSLPCAIQASNSLRAFSSSGISLMKGLRYGSKNFIPQRFSEVFTWERQPSPFSYCIPPMR